MKVEISQVSFKEILPEVLPLIEQNFNETSWHNDRELSLNESLMAALEVHDMHISFVARINGELVGYTTYFINRHPHVDAKQAYQDVIFVKPEHRKSISAVALKLLTYAESVLISKDVKYIINGCPVQYDDGYSSLLKKLDYVHLDTLFGKKV